MRYKVIVATRFHEDQPWDFSVAPVASFIDADRAIRFARSEVKDGWGSERVRVVAGRRVVWPESSDS